MKLFAPLAFPHSVRVRGDLPEVEWSCLRDCKEGCVNFADEGYILEARVEDENLREALAQEDRGEK